MSTDDNTAFRSRYRLEHLCWVPLAAVFPSVGFVVGWLGGASQTPVVATLLPLIVGLLGALSLGLLERTLRAKQISEKLAQFDDGIRERVEKALEIPAEPSLALPAFWAAGVILFALACFWGVQSGVQARWSAPVRFETGYPTLKALLKLGAVETPAPPSKSPDEPNGSEKPAGPKLSEANQTPSLSKSSDTPSKTVSTVPIQEGQTTNSDSEDDPAAATEEAESADSLPPPSESTANAGAVEGAAAALKEDYKEVIGEIVAIFKERPELIPFVWQELRLEQEAMYMDFTPVDDPEDLTPAEMALLHTVYVQCRVANIPGEQLKLIFKESINPVLRTKRIGRQERLETIVDVLFPSGSGESATGGATNGGKIRSPGIGDVPPDVPGA